MCESTGSGNFDVSSSGSIDSDLDANCNGGIVDQTGAYAICVLHYESIHIASGATLGIVSSVNTSMFHGGRGIALVADHELLVDGTLDVSAHGASDGPGGGVTRSGASVVNADGGGGAGFKTSGGAGGNATADGGTANGGAASTDPALLVPLVGGPYALGGGGGAAVLISCRSTVSISGVVNAGGGGAPVFLSKAGNGGGAGGYVVIEAPKISVTGEVYANGGAGCGGDGTTSRGMSGADATVSDTYPASGGLAGAGGGGAGGAGGISGVTVSDPGPGRQFTSGSAGGGGGGGSVGFFQTYTPAGVTPTLTPSHASPAFQPNGTIPTR